ncbi:unnamed protein product [Rotaria magnacalcarata]|uniref:Polyketide synthase n=1 Tax=Rotaria magnacalcarata TaxID=392030 RepID=A0A816XS72_9BILA|nr:unnamed protein product [Rotaria magnacalcarata]
MTSKIVLQEPVAIVGIACEFAGDIHSPADLWHALENSRDLGTAVPADRMDLYSFCAHMFNQDKDGQLQKQLIHAGYFLSKSHWDTFDQSFFGISNSEAISIDPAHRLLLLKFVHLLDDAGYTMEMMYGSRTSVHIGQFSADHAYNTFRMKPEHRSRLHGPNSMLYNAAARISYYFNLHGPNASVDVACSSSIEAIHLAVQTLRTGEADMAVCGGVNSVYTPETLLIGSMIGAQSPDGRSRSFSIDANGYAKGEGLGLLLLKRLSDAERDGDRIYCVLRDVLSRHDGNEGKNNYVVPSGIGQKCMLADIYERAQIDPGRVFYVEAHGTGTQVGDPIEANALGEFFARSPLDSPLLIGSVKSNLGHTEGASGVAALIKIAMCMRHRIIPPNMHFKALNPKIEAQHYNLHIVQHFVPFPPPIDNPVLIGINSFGMGGNTTHVIVEEYRPEHEAMLNRIDHIIAEEDKDEIKQQFIFIFSTKCYESLLKQVAQFNVWLHDAFTKSRSDHASFLARVSKQLLLKRTISYNHLAIIVSDDRIHLQQQIDAFLVQQSASGLFSTIRQTSAPRKFCFVYSGQGPQWWAMGRQLYKTEPVFCQWIQRIDNELAKITNGEWRLVDELIGTSSENESRINDTNIAQPALFAIQVALTALLISWRIFPSTIVSHSAGEQASSFVSGRVTLQEAVRIVYHRSRLQHRATRQGGRMLAVSMSEPEARSELLKGIEHLVCVAVVNSPRSVTLSGDEATIDELQRILSTLHPTVFKARLRIENAFHSHQMDRFDIRKEMLSSLEDIRGLPLQDPKQMFDVICAQARLYSSVSGSYVDEHTPLDAHHCWSNVRNCVQFGDAVKAIIQDAAADAFLEISPHPVLVTSIRECYASETSQPLILPTLKRKECEQTTLLTSIAQLVSSPVVWQQFLKSRNVLPTEDDNELFEAFPLYAFHNSPCWYESKESVIERLSHRHPIHPLLGIRQWTPQTSATWKCLINLNLHEHAFLKDHKIQDAILFPATGFLELGIAACRQLLPPNDGAQPTIVFEQVEFTNALVLNEHQLIEVFTQVVMPMREWFVYSRPWTSAGQDCIRTSGMSGTDVLNSFIDPQILSQYSLSEFTAHARGRISIGDTKQQLPLLTDTTIPRDLCSMPDPLNVYAHLSLRGYQYGPSCRLIQSVHSTRSTVETQINCNIFSQEDLRCYHLIHPAVLDACLHSPLALIPGVPTIFLPVAINKVTIPGETIAFHSTIQTRAAYHASISGTAEQRTYEFDCTILPGDTMIEKPLLTLERFKIQQVLGAQSDRWTSDKSIFDKLNISMDLPNQDLTEYLDTVMTDYCLKTIWTEKPIVIAVGDLLPSPEDIITKAIDLTGDQDLIESIEPLNELAAYYAQLALQDLLLDSVQKQQQQSLLAASYSIASYTKAKVTFHSTQIYLIQLFDRFPRLKPILAVLAACGQRLKHILTGDQDGLNVLLGHEQTEQALQQLQSLISVRQMHLIFNVLNVCLRQKHTNSLIGRKLRILWLGGDSCSDVLPVLHLLLNLCHETCLLIDLHYTDPNSALLTQAEQTFRTHLADQNRLRITYHDGVDLSNGEHNEKFSVESYDIAFAANKLQGSPDLLYSLVAINRLLVPNGLLLLLELTHAPLYFDFIFGLVDQWWSPIDCRRALLNVEQWTTAIRQTGGFETVQSAPSPFGNTIIVAQKSASCKILQTHEERQRQAWLLFVDDNTPNIGNALIPLLPSSNIILVHPFGSNHEDIRFKVEQMMAMYEQVYIVFGCPLNQALINDNSEMAFTQQEKHLCGTLVHILQTIRLAEPYNFPFVYVVTRNAQCGAGKYLNPIGASLVGLVRSLTLEYERHRLKLIDLQASVSPTEVSSLMHALAQHVVASQYVDDLDEIVLREDKHDGSITRGEWHYEMLQQQQNIMDKSKSKSMLIIPHRDADQQPFRLQVAPSHFLDDLIWIRDKVNDEFLSDGVEVRVHCVGLNFRDVLKVRGLYPHTRPFALANKEQSLADRDTEPGIDFVGTVLRSPSDSKYKPGNRVLGISFRGMFHSHVLVDAREIVHIPEECHHITDEQLAAMPNSCLTVLYSLKYRVHLRPDQTVLVHAATGGAGQACIQYCQSIGARVLATAGSNEKRRFLREYYGIKHVFNSRDFSFINDVRTLLPDGVDVIVNSLTGPLLQESIKLLSLHGHFVEWGKRDVFDKSHISMFALRNDCSFHVIDVSSLKVNQLNIFGELIEEVMQLIIKGIFRPIEPTNIYEPSEVVEVFKQCNSGQIIGKCVIRLTSSHQPLYLNNQQLTPLTKG